MATGIVNNAKPKTWRLLLIFAALGIGALLVWKYRFLIKGWFSGGNPATGPDIATTEAIVKDLTEKPGGTGSAGGGNGGDAPQSVTPYWPLKKGSKNENVRWVQIMLNKVPGTGPRITEDGEWGNGTEKKVKAAGAYFGLTKTLITGHDYVNMLCKTWPDSTMCAKIKKELPDLLNTSN